jgi:transposase
MTRLHRSRAVTAYLQSEAMTSVPWPAMSPDLNLIEHICDMLCKPLLSLHHKRQLAGCSLEHRLYFYVSKPSSGRRLHEAETGSRLPNGACAMSLDSNFFVLCTMSNVIVDLVTMQGNLTGDQYIRDVLHPAVVPHFDNYPLATRPMYMDDNARPHRSRAVTASLQSEAMTSVPWPAMSSDLNPIEHSRLHEAETGYCLTNGSCAMSC